MLVVSPDAVIAVSSGASTSQAAWLVFKLVTCSSAQGLDT